MMKRLLIIFPSLAIIGLVLYFIFTTVPAIRFWVDDFCAATILRNNGYFGAQITWWNSWTGRYSFIAVLDFFEKIGPWTVHITPIVVFSLLVASMFLALFSNLILATLFITIAIINSPNIIQSFYWQMGSINYTASFIFLNLFLWLLIVKSSKLKLYIPFVLLFIAGGFSEPFALSCGVFLIFVLFGVLAVSSKHKAQRIKIVIAGIIGVAISLLVMLLSPGNTVREASVTHPESLLFIIKSTILGTKWYLLRMLEVKPFVHSLIVIFSSVILYGKKLIIKNREAIYLMLISAFAAVFSVAAVIAAGYYSMSILPPERTLFIAIYFMLLCFMIFSFALSSLLNSLTSKWFFWEMVLVNFIFSIMLIRPVITHLANVKGEIQLYARAFDKIEPLLISSAGKAELPINNIKPVGELDSFTDNKGWVATCLGQYYKIGSIKVSP